jgi:hypothetical protein
MLILANMMQLDKAGRTYRHLKWWATIMTIFTQELMTKEEKTKTFGTAVLVEVSNK